MRRGALAFLGRKDRSLFDTSIKMGEMDNAELVLNSPTSPESGTASVRARPTVKHYTTSESFQGFAVPTPRVPVLPTINGPKVNGAVYGDQLPYGLVEEDILVPPPPSSAPPPPPETFVLPPPDFLGYLSNLEMTGHQPPPKPPPKPPLIEEKNRRIIKPPLLAPPKPPSTGSSSSASSTPISKPSPAKVPKHPTFPPPLPPTKGQQNTLKTPPPKPIRLSSMGNLNSPPQIPPPPPPVHVPTQSTFNPQNTAKLNHVSNASVLSGYEEQDTRPKHMLLLEDTGSVKPVPMLVAVNGNVARETPTKPIRKDPRHQKDNLQSAPYTQTSLHEPPKDVLDHKEDIQSSPPSWSLMPDVTTRTSRQTVSAQNETVKPLRVPYQIPKTLQTGNRKLLTSEDIQGKLGPKPAGKLGILSDHKLQNLKNGESSAGQEAPAASPLSLLMAAKEREKYKGFLSHENETTKNDQRRGSIQKNNSILKPFTTLPRSLSSSSLLHQDKVQVSPTSVSPGQYWESQPASITELSRGGTFEPARSWTTSASSTDMSNRRLRRKDSNVNSGGDKGYVGLPLLPPPPEFDDFDDISSAPSSRPSIPTLEMTPQLNINSLPPAHSPPAPAPKPSKNPTPNFGVQTNTQFQTNSRVDPTQRAATLSPSQATLVSILQKKMLEMDHKIITTKETDYDAEEWGVPLSENINVPVIPKTMPQAKSISTGTNPTPNHHNQEVGGKAVKKHLNINSNESQSVHQHGMTYRIRPGTKQPITLIRKGPS
ncbi:uncharacterized protein C6orf132 homolog [Syngnathoides biaculeatus]|uniref:uncharacterized protein C6orf132 homolog n=1 Tax=Syngnathoides biaculeatus TaxID=300417 RepID=UPI002ADE0CE4|nr:uncharacterized protein C6orf132 homolog [Syngnathoides biaculeatus]XP_061688775.1 uncharacterized protein C6orf132 homolog [Syngnathoides biaculeatus]